MPLDSHKGTKVVTGLATLWSGSNVMMSVLKSKLNLLGDCVFLTSIKH